MKRLNSILPVLVVLLGVASETLLVAPKDYEQMAARNKIGESLRMPVSTSGSEKLPAAAHYYQKIHLNQFPAALFPFSSNSLEESVDSESGNQSQYQTVSEFGDNIDADMSGNLGLPDVMNPEQKRCFVDYRQHLLALLANSTSGSTHKVKKLDCGVHSFSKEHALVMEF